MNSNQKLENLQRRIKIQTEQVGTFGGGTVTLTRLFT